MLSKEEDFEQEEAEDQEVGAGKKARLTPQSYRRGAVDGREDTGTRLPASRGD